MKKTYKSSLLALSVLASFTSCSESESLQQANLSKDKITFHATLDNTWKPLSPASSSRAAIAAATEKGPIVVPTPFGKPLYLHPVVQDGIHIWSKEGKPITRSGAPLEDVEHERVAQTRGTMSTKIGDYGSFGVTAIYKEGENNVLLLDNAKAEKTDGEFWGFTNNSNAKWPIGSTVSFHAYAPHSSADKSMLTYGVDKDNVQTQISYTASTTADDIINQPDLIVATNTGSRQLSDADDAVQLDFYHALTAVSFALSSDLVGVIGNGYQLVEISLKGIPNKGVCELKPKAGKADEPSCVWTQIEGSADYVFDLTDKEIVINENLEDMALTDPNQTLMMIPQELTGAQLTFKFKLNNHHVQEFNITLPKQTWEAGKSVVYKLSANAVNTVNLANVNFPQDWTDASYPKTDFDLNDKIGLYVVDKDNHVLFPNVELTKQANGWVTNNGKKFLERDGYKYFAYYPYSSELTEDKIKADAATAEDFFADKIQSLNKVADQSTKEKLLAQDFQVAMGEVANATSLNFNMKHKVGLAVINFVGKQTTTAYQFVNESYLYYYRDSKYTTEPVENRDYYKRGTINVFPSDKFVGGNVPFSATEEKHLQITPIGETMKYMADDRDGEKDTGWGKFEDACEITVNSVTPVEKEVQLTRVPDYYYLARLFSCTGNIQTFTAPVDEKYTLQCWGASGGTAVFGGGYSYGDYTMEKGKMIYICVGGMGAGGNKNRGNVARGGYNGGGNGGMTGTDSTPFHSGYGGGDGGGGATHIALQTGLLTTFKDTYKDQVLLVAGGAGGGLSNGVTGGNIGLNAQAGYSWGGGENGSAGVNYSYGAVTTSATQDTGYAFGQGQNGVAGVTNSRDYINGKGSGGAGGGLWGGYSAKGACHGGGGSGFVNTKFLTDAHTIPGNEMFITIDWKEQGETGHKGYGHAQIYWLPPRK